jgi:hypothetical protein
LRRGVFPEYSLKQFAERCSPKNTAQNNLRKGVFPEYSLKHFAEGCFPRI